MRQVISASPSIDISAYVKRIAAGRPVATDPTRSLCERHGFRTLYEVPIPLQKRLRRELLREHAEMLRERRDVICDHSVFAWLADWMRWIWSYTPAEEWESVLVESRPAIDRSETILHVTSGPLAAADGYRWMDPRNAAQVEHLMRALYREFNVESKVQLVSL